MSRESRHVRPVAFVETFHGKSLALVDVGLWYWRLRSGNGRILATSEGYASRSSRDRIVARVSLASGFEVRKELGS